MSEYFKRVTSGEKFRLINPDGKPPEKRKQHADKQLPHVRAERQQDDMRAMKEFIFQAADVLQRSYKMTDSEDEQVAIKSQMKTFEWIHLHAQHNFKTYAAIQLNPRGGLITKNKR